MLFAIDIDGTLLHSDGSLPKANADVLRKAASQGHTVVLSSGRPPRSLLPIYGEIGLSAPLVAYNGGYVFDPGDPGFPERRFTFRRQDLIDVEKAMRGRLISIMCESSSAIYGNGIDRELDKYFPYAGMKHVFGPLEEVLKEDCFTALFRCRRKEDERLLEHVLESHKGVRYRHWRSSPYAEAFIEGADKGDAIAYIQEKTGIPKEQTVAIGDSDNDFGMLKNSQFPYLMANFRKKPEVEGFRLSKRSNDEDGVAAIVASFLGA